MLHTVLRRLRKSAEHHFFGCFRHDEFCRGLEHAQGLLEGWPKPETPNGGFCGRRSRERPSAESSKTGLRNILDPLPHMKFEGLGRLVTALYTCTNALDQEPLFLL